MKSLGAQQNGSTYQEENNSVDEYVMSHDRHQQVIPIGTVCCQIFLRSFEAATYAFLRRRYGGKEKESFKKCPKIFSKNGSILNRVDKKRYSWLVNTPLRNQEFSPSLKCFFFGVSCGLLQRQSQESTWTLQRGTRGRNGPKQTSVGGWNWSHNRYDKATNTHLACLGLGDYAAQLYLIEKKHYKNAA